MSISLTLHKRFLLSRSKIVECNLPTLVIVRVLPLECNVPTLVIVRVLPLECNLPTLVIVRVLPTCVIFLL